MANEATTERTGQMTRTLLTIILLTLYNQMAWADQVPDKDKYSAAINNTIGDNGADCSVQSYSVKTKTVLEIIFSIKCTRSSYLNEIEVTCTQTPSERCFVSGY